MAYATVEDVQARIGHTLTAAEQETVSTQLDDAAVIIDAFAPSAAADAKKVVSCRMVVRLMGADDAPVGATQGSMAGLGYSQSWTITGGANGELYLSKMDKNLLGMGNNIGSYSPIEELAKCTALQ